MVDFTDDLPARPEHKIVHFTWYDIVNDDKPVLCSICNRVTKVANCVYVTRDDGDVDAIAEKSCLGETFLQRQKKGEGMKQRNAARLWHIKKPVLKLVHSTAKKKSRKVVRRTVKD